MILVYQLYVDILFVHITRCLVNTTENILRMAMLLFPHIVNRSCLCPLLVNSDIKNCIYILLHKIFSFIIFLASLSCMGTAVAQRLRCYTTNWKVAGLIPASVIGIFIDIKSFRPHYGPRFDSALNRNEYQEHFLGVKAAGA